MSKLVRRNSGINYSLVCNVTVLVKYTNVAVMLFEPGGLAIKVWTVVVATLKVLVLSYVSQA